MPSLTGIIIFIGIIVNIKSMLDNNKNKKKASPKLKSEKNKKNYNKTLNLKKEIQTKAKDKLESIFNQDNLIEKDKTKKSDKIIKIEKEIKESKLDTSNRPKLGEVEIYNIEKEQKPLNKPKGKDLILAHELMAGPLCKRRKHNKIRP